MTKEEIKAAVLAEFRQVCLRPMYFYPVDNDTRLIFNGTQYEIYIGLNCLLSLSVVGENKNTDWLAAYRLLGLESRAKDAEIEWLRAALDSMTDSGFLLGRCDLFLEDESAVVPALSISAIQSLANNALKGGTNES